MNKMQIFNNPEFGRVRIIEIDGEPWLVGKDVCEAFGDTNYRRSLARLEDYEKGVSQIATPGGLQSMTVVNEAGLYSLLFYMQPEKAKGVSQNEQAIQDRLDALKRFRHWVTSEVLPSIRKNGGYITGQEELSPDELMAKALQVAQKTLAEREARIAALTVDNLIMQPKAEYFDELVDRNLLTNFTEAAKQIGLKRKVLIDFMTGHGYLYRDKKGNLLPYANKKTEGLFEVKQSTNQKTGWAGCQTLMTPKGVETFRLLCQGM